MSRIEGYQTKMTAGPPYHWQRVRWSSVTYICGSRMRGLVIQAALVAGLEERDVGVWIQTETGISWRRQRQTNRHGEEGTFGRGWRLKKQDEFQAALLRI